MSVITSAIGTILGPLTTSWSIPPSCTVNLQPCPTCDDVLFQGQRCAIEDDEDADDDRGAPTGTLQDDPECWPPTTSDVPNPQHPLRGWGFYSPGLACPTGYVSACTAVHGSTADWDIQFRLTAGETAIGCCPE